MRKIPPSALLLAALACGAALRLWGISFGLPHTEARPDESTIIAMAIRFWKDGFRPISLIYPTLITYILALVYGVSALFKGAPEGVYRCLMDWYASSPAFFFLTARLMGALAGTATVYVCWLAGREAAGETGSRRAAFFSSAFMALCYLHARDSHFGALDAPMTFFIALSAYYCLKSLRTQAGRDYLLAGIAAGLAAGTKYAGVLLVFPVLAAHIISVRDGKSPFLGRGPALFTLGLAGAFMLTTPWLVLDPARTLADYRFHKSLHGFMSGGSWLYHIQFTLYRGLGAPLFFSALAGMILLLRENWRRGVVLFSFAAVYFLVLARTHSVYARYGLPLLPFCCIAAGYFAAAAQKLRPAVWIALFSLITLDSAAKIVKLDSLLAKEDSRALAMRGLDAKLPPSASICQTGTDYTNLQFNWDKKYLAFRADEADRAGALIRAELYRAKLRRACGSRVPVYYDGKTRAFASYDGKKSLPPDYIISPVPPFGGGIPQGLKPWLSRDYEPFAVYKAFSGGNIYDETDAFFVPFGWFSGVRMPGPDIYVFKRKT
ncbi:MAG: glycosyltransferase family 39 protein [Elusimicrobiales bacterium]